jgi:hypothetical protein
MTTLHFYSKFFRTKGPAYKPVYFSQSHFNGTLWPQIANLKNIRFKAKHLAIITGKPTVMGPELATATSKGCVNANQTDSFEKTIKRQIRLSIETGLNRRS